MLAVVALSYEEEAVITNEERKKDLLEHRDDSTFSFDPSILNVKKLNKNSKKKIDSRKGVLLASYTRKKTRRKKVKPQGAGLNDQTTNNNNSSITPTPSATPRHSNTENQSQDQNLSQSNQQRSSSSSSAGGRGITFQDEKVLTPSVPMPNMLHPPADQRVQLPISRQASSNESGVQEQIPDPNMLYPQDYRGQLMPSSRQTSSNASEGGVGGYNRESSLDDSGVVDDLHEQDGNELVHISSMELQRELTPVTLALSPREVRLIKCNGNIARIKKHNIYALHQEYSSEIVVIGEFVMFSYFIKFLIFIFIDDLPDRNCDKCVQCCVDYEGWLQFQNCLYKVSTFLF